MILVPTEVLIDSVVGAQLGVRQGRTSVCPALSSATPHTDSNWPDQFGGKLNREQDPSKTDNRYSILHMSTGKTDVVTLDHIHIGMALFGHKEETQRELILAVRQMHNVGGQDVSMTSRVRVVTDFSKFCLFKSHPMYFCLAFFK